MAKRGSSKPCPGCGKVDSGRPANEVCINCRRLLKKAAWLEEQWSMLDTDEIVVAMGEYPHWNQYIHSRSGRGRDILDALHRLALAGSRPSLTSDYEFRLLGKIESSGYSYLIMLRPLAETIRDLRQLVVDALEAEYQAGKKDGHNIIMRLAEGDLSISDLDKETGRR